MITKRLVNEITYGIVGCAIQVHKELGPGLLESIYEDCLCIEMKNKGISFQRQVPLTLTYKGIKINRELRIDILVEELVIVELKAIDHLLPIHEAQLLSYLHQAKVPKGVLINFNEMNITKTLVPMVTKQFALLPDN